MNHMLLALSLSLVAAVLVITLERTACFGSCPIYKLEIFADGAEVLDQLTALENKIDRVANTKRWVK